MYSPKTKVGRRRRGCVTLAYTQTIGMPEDTHQFILPTRAVGRQDGRTQRCCSSGKRNAWGQRKSWANLLLGALCNRCSSGCAVLTGREDVLSGSREQLRVSRLLIAQNRSRRRQAWVHCRSYYSMTTAILIKRRQLFQIVVLTSNSA